MKRIASWTLASLLITGLSAPVLFADSTPITAGLNAPAINYTGGAEVIWGPLVSQSYLNVRGSANNNYPQKIAGSSISGNGGAAGVRDYCAATSAPDSGPGTLIAPSTAPVYEWFCNYPAPPAPQVNFADYKIIAQSQGNSCGGQPCYNASPSPQVSGIHDVTCTVNGQPKVWFFEGSPKFSGGTYFCGVIVSKGSVGFTGSGTGIMAATPPSNAWQQYEVATPNGPAGFGDTAAADQYPGDAGLHAVKPYTISAGVTFKGYVYASTGYSAGGGTIVLGSVQFGAGAASSSGGGTIYFQPTKIFSPPPPNQVNAPIISPPGGAFISPVQVSMTDTTPGSAIHYTLDGSTPTAASPLYTGPFTLSADTTVKAIALLAGLSDSAVTPAVFTFGAVTGGNPAPILNSLTPNTTTAGSPSFTMTVNGSQFVSGAVVNWNGSSLPTIFVNAGVLQAAVPASNVASSGNADIQVTNPDAQTSGTLPFTITTVASPAPMLTSLTPDTTMAGSPSFTMTVNGAQFVAGAVVIWNNAPLSTSFINPAMLTASVPAADVQNVGSANIQVTNPDAQTSNILPFTVTNGSVGNPPATLSRISILPSSATLGVGSQMTFTAVGYDQNNTVMTGVLFDWAITGPNNLSSTTGSAATVITAGNAPGAYSLSASSNGITGTANVAVQDVGIGTTGVFSLIDPASATPNPVTGVTTHLHVLAQSTNPGPISYHWDFVGLAAGIQTPMTHDSDVTFTQPGTYQFMATITDSQGLILNPVVNVTVTRTITQVVVNPPIGLTTIGQNFPFAATALDQFGQPMPAGFTWSATLGSVSGTGSFISLAPAQNITIKATTPNNVSGTAKMTVTGPGVGGGNIDLSNAKAYPVPYKSTSGLPGVTFSGLTANTTIKIFTTDGYLAQTLHSDGANVIWPVTNIDNERVSSGVYYFNIDNGAEKKEGKLVIIQ